MHNYIVTLNWSGGSEDVLDVGGYEEMIIAASNPYAATEIAKQRYRNELERARGFSSNARPANVVSTA